MKLKKIISTSMMVFALFWSFKMYNSSEESPQSTSLAGNSLLWQAVFGDSGSEERIEGLIQRGCALTTPERNMMYFAARDDYEKSFCNLNCISLLLHSSRCDKCLNEKTRLPLYCLESMERYEKQQGEFELLASSALITQGRKNTFLAGIICNLLKHREQPGEQPVTVRLTLDDLVDNGNW